jgi:hypothetical protein
MSNLEGVFWQLDPLAEKFPNMSPYSYSFNNPLKFKDNDGKWPTYIHTNIIRKALGDVFNEKQLEAIANGSVSVDAPENQSPERSYMHAMRSPDQTIADAQTKMQQFINEKENTFISKEGDESLTALGEALHPIMDATSPAHEGFQVWRGLGTFKDVLKGAQHVAMQYLEKKGISGTLKELDRFRGQAEGCEERSSQEAQPAVRQRGFRFLLPRFRHRDF